MAVTTNREAKLVCTRDSRDLDIQYEKFLKEKGMKYMNNMHNVFSKRQIFVRDRSGNFIFLEESSGHKTLKNTHCFISNYEYLRFYVRSDWLATVLILNDRDMISILWYKCSKIFLKKNVKCSLVSIL